MEKAFLKIVATLACLLLSAGGAGAQWYSHNSFSLKRIDPTTGDTLATVGSFGSGVIQARGLAISPVTGVAYLEYQSSSADWRLGTVDLTTGMISDVGSTLERLRGLAFDATGKLWAVAGQVGSHSLYSVDTSTADTALENGSLPTTRNKIAYNPLNDTLLLLGWNNGAQAWQLYSFSPADPTSLTQIAIQDPGLDDDNNAQRGGMGFDPVANVLLTEHSVDPDGDVQFAMISPTGVVSSTGAPITQVYFGLDAGPSLIFADGFESGDTLEWSDTVP